MLFGLLGGPQGTDGRTYVTSVAYVTSVRHESHESHGSHQSHEIQKVTKSERLANTKFDVFHKGFYCRTHVRDPDFFGSVSRMAVSAMMGVYGSFISAAELASASSGD